MTKAESLADHIQRASFNLAVNPTDILPDDSQGDQLYATDEEDGHEKRGPSTDPFAREQTNHESVHHAEERDHRGREAHPRRNLQGRRGKRRDSIDCKPEHFPDRILRLASEARCAAVRHGHLAKTDPPHHSTKKPVALRHAAKSF